MHWTTTSWPLSQELRWWLKGIINYPQSFFPHEVSSLQRIINYSYASRRSGSLKFTTPRSKIIESPMLSSIWWWGYKNGLGTWCTTTFVCSRPHQPFDRSDSLRALVRVPCRPAAIPSFHLLFADRGSSIGSLSSSPTLSSSIPLATLTITISTNSLAVLTQP